MPPRKSVKRKATKISTTHSILPRLPSQIAYSIPEIRQKILGLLAKSELARFMRVQKAVMYDVAKVLYYEVTFDFARSNLKTNTIQRKLVCAAVRVVDARNITMTRQVLIDTGYDQRPYDRWDIRRYATTYRLEVMNMVIALVRRKCPNIRQIIFGTDWRTESGDSWKVDIRPIGGALSLPYYHPGDLGEVGHVDLVTTITYRTHKPIPAVVDPIPIPPAGFSISHRVNPYIDYSHHHRSSPGTTDRWHKYILSKARLGLLGSAIEYGALPTALSHLSNVYKAQVAFHGTRNRLELISARCLDAFTANEFRSFAKIASVSLKMLYLYGTPKDRGQPTDQPKSVTITLIDVVATVRTYLPSLSSMHVDMQGVGSSEQDYRPSLLPDALELQGSLNEIEITTMDETKVLFNTLRYITRLCNFDVGLSVHLGPKHTGDAQTEFVEYLHQQEPSRRAHLAIVDFATLGITKLDRVHLLQYHPDGRPRPLIESQVSLLSNRMNTAKQATTETLIPDLQNALSACTAASAQLEQASEDGDQDRMLAAVEELGKAVETFRMASKVIQESIEAGTEAYIQRFAKSLTIA